MALAEAAFADWSLDALRRQDRRELAVLFRELPAPDAGTMDGEYDSALPDYSDAEWRATMAKLGKDHWLGKSYSPQRFGAHRGHGLNRYRRADGSVVRLSRFVWDIAPSMIDQRASLLMRYAPFDNWGGGHDLIDEIRLAGPGCYLGLYHTATPVPGFTPHTGDNGRSACEYFIFTGPQSAFVPADHSESRA